MAREGRVVEEEGVGEKVCVGGDGGVECSGREERESVVVHGAGE